MDHVEESLDLLAQGGLTPPEKASVEKHLASCARCRKAYETVLSRRGMIKETAAPRASDQLVSATLKKIYDEAATEGRPVPLIQRLRALFLPYRTPAMAFTGLFFVCLVGVLLFQKEDMVPRLSDARPQAPAPQAGVEQAPTNQPAPVATETGKTQVAPLSKASAPAVKRAAKAPRLYGSEGGYAAKISKKAKPQPEYKTMTLAEDSQSNNTGASKKSSNGPGSDELAMKSEPAPASIPQHAAEEAPAPIPNASSATSLSAEGSPSMKKAKAKLAPAATTHTRMVKAAFDPAKGEKAVVEYGLDHASRVNVRVLDQAGTEIAVLDDGERSAGTYQASWDGTDKQGDMVGKGIYQVVIETDLYKEKQQVFLVSE